jgi:hypothetical protein
VSWRWPTTEFPSICPFCNQHHEAATAMGETPQPSDGAVSMCFQCGQFSVFDSDTFGGLRKPTKKEQRHFDRDEKLRELVTAWKVTRRQ